MDQQSGWPCFSVRTAPFSGWTDVTDCDSLYFPRLSSKICASGWKPLTYHFLTITLHFLPPPISSYFLTCFRLTYDSSREWFSPKINCQKRTVPLRS